MAPSEAYPLGQRCWFPDEVEGFVSGDLVRRDVKDNGEVLLEFKDDLDRVGSFKKDIVVSC